MLKRILLIASIVLLTACSTREIQSSLTGSTAQRLVTHSIDDIVRLLPDEPFSGWRGETLYLQSYFLHDSSIKAYADERLKQELTQRFGLQITKEPKLAQHTMSVFYTSLATDKDTFGLTIPLGYVPGFDDSTKLNILSLEKFHGIAELYYFVGDRNGETRHPTLQSKVKTDALGLPFITIPLSNLDRAGEKPSKEEDKKRRRQFHADK
ncbi:MAG: hypothetical protein R3183_13230 [Oleiphilaceae bacterium]|nr:hypothetical protein [Oleiphilaceae bacterium]